MRMKCCYFRDALQIFIPWQMAKFFCRKRLADNQYYANVLIFLLKDDGHLHDREVSIDAGKFDFQQAHEASRPAHEGFATFKRHVHRKKKNPFLIPRVKGGPGLYHGRLRRKRLLQNLKDLLIWERTSWRKIFKMFGGNFLLTNLTKPIQLPHCVNMFPLCSEWNWQVWWQKLLEKVTQSDFKVTKTITLFSKWVILERLWKLFKSCLKENDLPDCEIWKCVSVWLSKRHFSWYCIKVGILPFEIRFHIYLFPKSC